MIACVIVEIDNFIDKKSTHKR